MKVLSLMIAAAALILTSGVARASRVNVNGGGPGSPSCGSLQFPDSPLGSGIFTFDCTTTAITSQITFAVPDSFTIPGTGFSCGSLLTLIGWSESTRSANGVDMCTFTAPSNLFSSLGTFNDGDCDLDDFTFGIPKGCDIKLTTSLPFEPNAVGDLSVNGAPLLPFPEPASLGLLATGLAALFVGRRRSKSVLTQN